MRTAAGRRWLIAPLLLVLGAQATACGEGIEVTCVDEACPAGQVCGEGGCVPIEPPRTTGDLGRYTSVALRPDGRRVIATYDTTYGNLVLSLERADGTFEERLVDGWRVEAHALVETDSGQFATVALEPEPADAQGQDAPVHVAWYDADQGELRYTRFPSSAPFEVADGVGAADRGRHASLALAEDGTVHLAYRDDTARALRHAERQSDGTWRASTLPVCAGEADCPRAGEEDYGEWAALAVVAGRPRIAFYDRLRGDLKMAERGDGGAWTVTTLDGRDPATDLDTGDVGRFARVAVDLKRRVAIAYFDATRGALRYLSPGGPSPKPLTVDDGVYLDPATGATRRAVVGQHVAMRFDAQGRAVLLYLDATRNVLERATVAGGLVTPGGDLEGLPPGVYVDFGIAADGSLRGAYGAFVEGEAPRTRLVPFVLTGGTSP